MSNIIYLYEYAPAMEPQSKENRKIKDELIAFRLGACPDEVKSGMTDVLRRLINGDTDKWTICFVPASDLETTISRYYDLSQHLSSQFPGCVYLNTLRLSEDYDELLEEARRITCQKQRVKGMNVVVIDYVYNTGSAFESIEKLLLENGAVSVNGLFIAKVTRDKGVSDKANGTEVPNKQ